MQVQKFFHRCSAEDFYGDALDAVELKLSGLGTDWRRGDASQVRYSVLRHVQAEGWSDRVLVDGASKLTLSAKRGSTGMCVQFGNAARLYADMLKLQLAYANKLIERAVYVLPSRPLARTLGSNLANADRLRSELDCFTRVLTVPTVVLSLGGDA